MKNKLILSSLLLASLVFAGPKSDLAKANDLIKENKSEEAIKLLENTKLVKGEEKEYEQINYALAMNYIQSDQDKAIKYLKKISDDINSKSEISIAADNYLVQLSKDDEQKVKYLERLSNRLENKDISLLANLNAYYILKGNDKKSSQIYDKVKKQENSSYLIDVLNISTAQELVNENFDKAKNLINKVLKSKDPAMVAEAHFLLSRYYFDKNENKKAEDEISKSLNFIGFDSSKFNNEQRMQLGKQKAYLLARIATLYKAMNDNAQNYEYLKKAYRYDSQNPTILVELISASYNIKDKKAENKWVGVLKNLDKNINDGVLANAFFQRKELELAKEFGKKSKDDIANYSMFLIYINEYNKEETLKYAQKILKTGTDEEKKVVSEVVKNPDLAIAELAYQNQNYNKARIFALMETKKSHKADLLLASIYLKNGDIDEAKKYAKSSLDNKENVEDAQKFLNELSKIK